MSDVNKKTVKKEKTLSLLRQACKQLSQASQTSNDE